MTHEIWIFRTHRLAEAAGFRDGAHRQDRTLQCWTPGREVDALRGRRPDRLVLFISGPALEGRVLETWNEAMTILDYMELRGTKVVRVDLPL